ncbi:MAG: hypothetical protein ACXABD_01590 [Candidatus Thorarchaeota archaeon]|jgi:hypothetical protein
MKEIFVVSFLYGLVAKIYDDVIDNKLKTGSQVIDYLSYITVSLCLLVCYLSGSFSFICFEMALLTFIMDHIYTFQFKEDTEESKDLCGMNDNVWMFTIWVSGMFSIYHLIKNGLDIKLQNVKSYTFLLFIMVNFLIVMTDIYFTPEHSSNRKYYARIVGLLLLSVVVFLMNKYSDYFYDGTIAIMAMNVGFLLSSVIFMSIEKSDLVQKLMPSKGEDLPS